MKINLDNKTADFIKKSGHEDVNVFVKGCSAWGTSEPQPLVLMGKPTDEPDKFTVTTVNGINVYVRNDVQSGDAGITIKYSKFLFKESLVVEGIEY